MLITGANQGIGVGFVKYYLDKGFTVYATYRSKEKSTQLLTMTHKNLILIQADYNDPENALERIKSVMRQNPLDILILNAGYFPYNANKLGTLETSDFQRAMTINAIAPILLVQGLIPNLLLGKDKKVVALSSRRGSIQKNKEENYQGRYGYTMSKAALNMGMTQLEKDCPELVVLIIHPGRVQTEFTKFDPSGLSVEESVNAMASVISAASSAQSGRFYDYQGTVLPW